MCRGLPEGELKRSDKSVLEEGVAGGLRQAHLGAQREQTGEF